MEQQKTGLLQAIKNKINAFLHDKELKEKLYVIIFESDTPKGKLFDVFLIGFIIMSVLVVILESVVTFSDHFRLALQILEYVFTVFFTFEYLVRIYCSPKPKKYIFSFFGIVDLLATLPLYLGFLFTGARYLLIIRTFRLIRVFRVFKLFNFLEEGNLLLVSLRLSSRKIFVFFFFVLILVTSIGTIMYMVEGTQPDTQFSNIPNCIYWAIVITPVTPVGRFISACVMLIGYTIIAVPTGIVSATMIKEHKRRSELRCPHCFRAGHEEDAGYCRFCGGKLDDTK